MMKEKYERAELEVIAFSTSDILIDSEEPYEGWNPNDPGGNGGEYEGWNPHP